MTRGASSHFSLKDTEYERYYPVVLGVFQNNGFLVAHAERAEDRSLVKGLPRSGTGHGIEVEIRRRRPKGIDVHVLVAPLEEFPADDSIFLSRQGVFGSMYGDYGSQRALDGVLPALRRDENERPLDPHFARRPLIHIPEWIFFDLKGGSVSFALATTLATLGAAYLLFWAPDGAYRFNEALMLGLLFGICPWFAGIFSRTIGRGFVAGFIVVAVPVAVYAAAASGVAFGNLQRSPGIGVIDGFRQIFLGAMGVVVPVALGFLAGIPGAIAGAVGGRIFPVRMKEPSLAD